jgi:DNA-binding transcriptional LysR family regulator
LVRRVVCGSPAYFAGHGIPKTPEDLSALAAITFDALGSATSWDFPVPGSKAEQAVPIRSRLSVNTAEAAIDAAIAGVGVTRVLSYQVADALAEGKLQIVLGEFEAMPLPVNFVHAGQGLLPLKIRAFLDFAAPRIRERLGDRAPVAKSRRRKN